MDTTGLPAHIILGALESALASLAAATHGTVIVASDPAHALDLLSNAPSTWRIVLGVDDEASAEAEQSRNGLSNTTIFTMVQTPVGLPNKPSVHHPRPDGSPSVMALAETVRAWMRGLSFQHPSIDCSMGFNWRSSAWAATKPDGKPLMYARQHNFDLLHVIAPPIAFEPQPINWPV